MACRTSWLASRHRKISNDGATFRPDQPHHSKDAGNHTVKTVFGPVAVPNPRWRRCACQSEGSMTFRPHGCLVAGTDQSGVALSRDEVGLADSVRQGGGSVARSVAGG